MKILRRGLVFFASLAVIVAIGACERQITRVEQVVTAQNCFDCHSDNNTFLVSAEQQWLNSVHASGNNIDHNDNGCQVCHTSEGFVASVTGGTVPPIVDNPTPIHCFTCHAPHTSGDFGLRVTTDAVLQNGVSFDLGAGNLCVSCHHSRQNVDTFVKTANDTVIFTSPYWGPHHSVQGDMLIGSNGYEYASFNYTDTGHKLFTTDGCIDCHKDVTQNLVLGGHSFNMTFVEAADTVMNTEACKSCHGTLPDFDRFGVQTSVEALLATLKAQLLAANLIDAQGHTVGSSTNPRVVASSDSAGAVWNFLLVEEDRSRGVHNREYIEGLLNSSILFMQGVLPAPPADVAAKRHGSQSGQR
ncbi:MAG: hypothetical protein ACE5EO_04100 [Candidatus Krumholzibacteriia bacterium]